MLFVTAFTAIFELLSQPRDILFRKFFVLIFGEHAVCIYEQQCSIEIFTVCTLNVYNFLVYPFYQPFDLISSDGFHIKVHLNVLSTIWRWKVENLSAINSYQRWKCWKLCWNSWKSSVISTFSTMFDFVENFVYGQKYVPDPKIWKQGRKIFAPKVWLFCKQKSVKLTRYIVSECSRGKKPLLIC